MEYSEFIHDTVTDLHSDYKLTDFEALQIACKMQQNETLAKAFMVNNDKKPVALEAIAMALGLDATKDGCYVIDSPVARAINNLSDSIDQIGNTNDTAVSFALNQIAKAIKEHE